jgi:hypothetical protein
LHFKHFTRRAPGPSNGLPIFPDEGSEHIGVVTLQF